MEISEYEQLFLSEAQEILNSSNNVLVELEKEPTDTALLNELFRYSHTLKSMAQSMGYEEIAKLTHSMEAALALLRSGRLKAEKDTLDLLFNSLDTLSALVEKVGKGNTKRIKVTPLVERFQEIASALPKEEKKSIEERKPNSKLADPDRSYTREGQSEIQTVRVPLTRLDILMDIAGELLINRIRLAEIAQTIEDTPGW